MQQEEQHDEAADAAGQAELHVGRRQDTVTQLPAARRRRDFAGGDCGRLLGREARRQAAAVVALCVLKVHKSSNGVAEEGCVGHHLQEAHLRRRSHLTIQSILGNLTRWQTARQHCAGPCMQTPFACVLFCEAIMSWYDLDIHAGSDCMVLPQSGRSFIISSLI